jgi:ferritin-like metal-binding protein YciE
MTISNLQEKFIFELGAIYDAEFRFLEAQQQMLPKASNSQLKSMLETHIQQTQQQIQNLEQVFNSLKHKPQRHNSEGAMGLVTDAQTLLKQTTNNPNLSDLVIAGAQAKVEAFEISCYRGLVAGAEQMGSQNGSSNIVQLLRHNLQQEEQTAQKVEQNLPQLLQQAKSSQQSTATR